MAQHGFADCPECGADVRLRGKLFNGQIVQCADCRVSLEISSLNPVSLLLADWSDEDEETSRSSRRLKRGAGRPQLID